MDANSLIVVSTVLGLAFALPGAILSVVLLRDRLINQHNGNDHKGQ